MLSNRRNGGTYVRYICFDAICEELKNFPQFQQHEFKKRTLLLFEERIAMYTSLGNSVGRKHKVVHPCSRLCRFTQAVPLPQKTRNERSQNRQTNRNRKRTLVGVRLRIVGMWRILGVLGKGTIHLPGREKVRFQAVAQIAGPISDVLKPQERPGIPAFVR